MSLRSSSIWAVWLLSFAACSSQNGSMPNQLIGTAGSAAGSAGDGSQAGAAGAAGVGSETAGTLAVDTGGSGAGTAGTASAATPDAATTADAGPGEDVDAANGGAGNDASVTPRAPKPKCLKNASQVVLLGDSYINWVSHTFPQDLQKESGATYRNYAVGAYSMGSGGIGFIPPQLDQAVTADPDITTIVMDGGGNDVLVPDTQMFPQGGDCKMSEMSPTISDCQKIVAKAIDAADKMMMNGVAKLSASHIEVVYFFYPNVPEGTLIGGTHPNAILEYAAPMVKDFCDHVTEKSNGKVSCHFIDLRPVFKGHTDYFAPTDIHPNPTGSAAMAKVVWQTMKDNCLAQPASSGCCEP